MMSLNLNTVDLPIIVQTLDNLWMQKVYVDTSLIFIICHLCHTLKERRDGEQVLLSVFQFWWSCQVLCKQNLNLCV